MPVRYRCPACRQLLSIATRMVGQTVNCPTCGGPTTVPEQDEPLDAPSIAPADESEIQGGEVGDFEPAMADDPPIEFQSIEDAAFHQDERWARHVAGQQEPAPALEYPALESPPPEPGRIDPRYELAGEGSASSGGFTFGRRRLDTEEMDLTPMVDMTFLLLIFFMITASFSLQKSIEFPPPSPEQQGAAQTVHSLEELENNSVIVRVDDKNLIYVDDEPVADRAKLAQALRGTMRSTARTEVVVSASDSAFHETVIAVIDAANEVGMQKIRLATHGETN